MVVCIISYPHKSVQEVAVIYHGKDEDALNFKDESDLACKLLARILEREELPQFLSVSAAEVRRNYMVSSYYEVGIPDGVRAGSLGWCQPQAAGIRPTGNSGP